MDHNRTPNRIPVPGAVIGMGMNASSGSGKRKASSMSAGNQANSGSPLKRVKPGNGIMPIRRGLEEETVSEEDLDGLGEDD